MKVVFSIMLILNVIGCTFTTLRNVSPKIIGGRDAEENEFPYVVSIRRAELENLLGYPIHVCGGSIVSSNTVLTASHCLFDPFGNHLHQPGSYYVVAGSRQMWTENVNEKYFAVAEIFKHPEFDPDSFDNDIAVLRIEPTFTFDLPHIQPILIGRSQNLQEGTVCSVHGWGVQSWGSSLIPDVLQTVDLSISNFDQCNSTYNGTITENQICAYEIDKDSCSGDSGSSFVCNNFLVGIVSFGYGCALPDVPGVYTKVSSFEDFIANYRGISSGARRDNLIANFLIMMIFQMFI